MKIHCLTTFLDGVDRFEQGDQRTVDDERGARLVANGWATDVSGEAATGEAVTGETTLAPDNVVITAEVRHG